MSTNIAQTIKYRLDLMGMSQAQFAESVSATAAQMGIFLKGKGSLSIDSLNKSLDLVGINLSPYIKRIELAKKVAFYLKSKNVMSIENWTKQDVATFTQMKEILLFVDVKSDKEYQDMENSGIIDIESTFPYFKALVTYYMTLSVRYMKTESKAPTASQAKRALSSILGGAGIGVLAVMSPTIVGTAVAAALVASKQMGAASLFSKTDKSSLFAKAIDYIKTP